jgi:spoIIIJ-associated protein
MSYGQSADAGVPGNPVQPEPADGAAAGNLTVGDAGDEAATGMNADGPDAADVAGADGAAAGGEDVSGDAPDSGADPDLEGPPWSEGRPEADGDEPEVTVADLEQEGEIAADYVEALLDIADLDGDIDMDVEGERAMVSVVGGRLDELVGSKGEVLEALQELTRLAVQRQTGLRTRMMLDVGGYRVHRREELTRVGSDAADEVAKTGEPKRLAPMTAFERKIVHDAVAAAGLRSESEGEDPSRRVIVYPAD